MGRTHCLDVLAMGNLEYEGLRTFHAQATWTLFVFMMEGSMAERPESTIQFTKYFIRP